MNNILTEIQEKVTGNFRYTELLVPVYENLEENTQINDPGGWRLRFYFTFDVESKQRPLTEAFAQDVLNGSFSIKDPVNQPNTYYLNSDNQKAYPFTEGDVLAIVQQLYNEPIGEKWDTRMVPERVNRNDSSGLSWRYDVQNSVWDKAYIFTSWNKPA